MGKNKFLLGCAGLIIIGSAVIVLVIYGGIVYAGWHFISKFW